MENSSGIMTKIGAFIVGILIVQCWRELLDITELLIALFIVTLCWLGRYWHTMLFVVAMIWVSTLASMRIAGQLPTNLEGQDLAVNGVIINLPKIDGYRTRFDFRVSQSSVDGVTLPEQLRLTWYNATEAIKIGQHWRFTVRLKRPRGSLNPGGFDYERWLFSQNIGATGYIRKQPTPVLLTESSALFNYARWRQAIGDYLNLQLNGNEFLGVIKALTIGDRQQITPAQWQLFRATGTVHIVAISGLHIGLISGLVFFLVWKVSARLGIQGMAPSSIAALSAMFAAIVYAALAGFSIPTQRALLMLLLVMLCMLRQRHHQALTVLTLVLLVVVIIDPFSVLSAGFWLSFFAVFLITFILSGRLNKPGYWMSIFKVNCLISMGLSPLLLFFFQQFSLIAPLANFMAIPIISLWVAPLLLVGLLTAWFSPVLTNFLLELVVAGVQLLVWLLARLDEFRATNVALPAPSLWAVVLAIIACLLIFMPRGLPGRWLGVVLLLPALFVPSDRPEAGQLKLTLLDVGQGLSVVIQTASHVLVYDTGVRYSAQFDSGASVVLPMLRSQGVAHVDLLMISHGDNDHIGGAASLLQEIKIVDILSSVPDQINNINAKLCQTGQTWIWDSVVFTVLSPNQQGFSSKNNNSCVLKIESKAGSVLLTGDIERKAEYFLVNTYPEKLNAEIMIAPHHGSNTSSSLQFLQAVNPKIILIAAGYQNRYGFPDQRVLDRYRQIGAQWFNVSETGAITVAGLADAWMIDQYRVSQRRYWNQ